MVFYIINLNNSFFIDNRINNELVEKLTYKIDNIIF